MAFKTKNLRIATDLAFHVDPPPGDSRFELFNVCGRLAARLRVFP